MQSLLVIEAFDLADMVFVADEHGVEAIEHSHDKSETPVPTEPTKAETASSQAERILKELLQAMSAPKAAKPSLEDVLMKSFLGRQG
jgi:hypothetical protein